MSKEYPVEIYPKPNERIKDSAERIYDRGYADGYQAQRDLTGWSNLTKAISSGERINWEWLNGVEAKCIHPRLGTLTQKLKRNEPYNLDQWITYVSFNGVNSVWDEALELAWQNAAGWTIWVKGELPLRKQTADQLEPGTCFRARYKKNGETHDYAWAQLLKPSGQTPRVIFFSLALTTLFGSALPEDVEVVEVYGVGTFDTPEGDA